MRLRVPVFVSQLITTSQILQMVAGVYVNWIAYQTKTYRPEIKCSISDENVKWSSLMYLSYFVLFFHFFLDAYIYSKRKSTKDMAGSKKSNSNGNLPIDRNNNVHAKHQNGQINKKQN